MSYPHSDIPHKNWNESYQQVRDYPTDTAQQIFERAKLLTLFDREFADAATIAVKRIVDDLSESRNTSDFPLTHQIDGLTIICLSPSFRKRDYAHDRLVLQNASSTLLFLKFLSTKFPTYEEDRTFKKLSNTKGRYHFPYTIAVELLGSRFLVSATLPNSKQVDSEVPEKILEEDFEKFLKIHNLIVEVRQATDNRRYLIPKKNPLPLQTPSPSIGVFIPSDRISPIFEIDIAPNNSIATSLYAV
eukprot:TRINITY_DN15360_c0_g1_i1.p1 TRINITY_DN15360_c0_g1~~TRINITY_DN15360_c0_g1_i1.p1  ORF type:complete len:245 (-),score=44.44 TRINITY_DN15360_c0_g1_i1:307-1041(-)